jgi:hypothetical protein
VTQIPGTRTNIDAVVRLCGYASASATAGYPTLDEQWNKIRKG